jgi:hypothetical protein
MDKDVYLAPRLIEMGSSSREVPSRQGKLCAASDLSVLEESEAAKNLPRREGC